MTKTRMRIFTKQTLKEFADMHPQAKPPIQEWVQRAEKAEWGNYGDMKNTFHSADAIGGQRYVFNIGGNKYRIVAVVKFTIGFIYIRFVGTHQEYDKTDIKNA